VRRVARARPPIAALFFHARFCPLPPAAQAKAAILALKDRTGSSTQAIKKYLNLSPDKFRFLNAALKVPCVGRSSLRARRACETGRVC
jgi:hypothetical protein